MHGLSAATSGVENLAQVLPNQLKFVQVIIQLLMTKRIANQGKCELKQGLLAEGEGSVRLTSLH